MIWILILNHLYLGDLILILKSSTYDDFAHLCIQWINKYLSSSVCAIFIRMDLTSQVSKIKIYIKLTE